MSPQQAPQQQSWSRSQDLDAALVYEVVSTPTKCLHLMGACFSVFLFFPRYPQGLLEGILCTTSACLNLPPALRRGR